MKLSVSYYVEFGKGDSSDGVEYDTVELSVEEAKAAIGIALTGEYDEIFELDELQETRDRLYEEIKETEIQNGIEFEDEYTMECQGELPMDTYELNELVHSRDEHALQYFDLEDASDEEIEEWDAEDLDDIPTIADFDPDFEPESPFDNGWSLVLYVDDVDIEEEELTAYLKSLFADEDFDTINDIKEYCIVEFDRDIEDVILEVAKELNCREYIESCNEDK